MSWRALGEADGTGVPKLENLARAARAGFAVPETHWILARSVAPELRPPAFGGPWILRSGSPTEDGRDGSLAGRFHSEVVPGEADEGSFAEAAARVANSLPEDAAGKARGVIFVQPLLEPERGGVAFFDGFYYERTEAPGGNQALTAGLERGEVRRGQRARGEAFSSWLAALFELFAPRAADGGRGPIDVEYAADGDDRFTLLQVRPALFPVRRNRTLSLANHKEILGDPPSPWIVSVLEEAGAKALGFFAAVDPEVATWNESYAVSAAGRAWLNFGFFFRLMDHWGLPRTFVTEGVGGEGAGGAGTSAASPEDGRVILRRFLCQVPRLVRLQLANLRTVFGARGAVARVQAAIDDARDLCELFDAGVVAMDTILRVNFAINGALAGITRAREFLRIRGRAGVITERMMHEYDALRLAPREEREERLETWLARYGHRGPLESDPLHPRFAELRELLREDLAAAPVEGTPTATRPRRPSFLLRPLFWMDRRRESFRDELMRAWQSWRARLLEAADELVEAGHLDAREDVFFLTERDLEDREYYRERARLRRAERERLVPLDLPDTTDQETIEALASGPGRGGESSEGDPGREQRSFAGIALGPGRFEGRVTRARELPALLSAASAGRARLDRETVLVVPALEPSWAVVFGRVGGVVAEIGGELSHSSILLREVGKPALVNCSGVFAALREGERVRIDGAAARLERLGP